MTSQTAPGSRSPQNPLVLDVSSVMRPGATTVSFDYTGPLPVRLGPAMIAATEGTDARLESTCTNMGDAIYVEATLTTTATGECTRCLRELTPSVTFQIKDVWALSPNFVTIDGSAPNTDAEDDELPPVVEDNRIDLTQAFLDEAGLELPFSPTCEDYGLTCDDADPLPEGITREDEVIDSRWAGLKGILDGNAD